MVRAPNRPSGRAETQPGGRTDRRLPHRSLPAAGAVSTSTPPPPPPPLRSCAPPATNECPSSPLPYFPTPCTSNLVAYRHRRVGTSKAARVNPFRLRAAIANLRVRVAPTTSFHQSRRPLGHVSLAGCHDESGLQLAVVGCCIGSRRDGRSRCCRSFRPAQPRLQSRLLARSSAAARHRGDHHSLDEGAGTTQPLRRRRRAIPARARPRSPRCRDPSAPRRRHPLNLLGYGVDDLRGICPELLLVDPAATQYDLLPCNIS